MYKLCRFKIIMIYTCALMNDIDLLQQCIAGLNLHNTALTYSGILAK
jgi:hypothetical protein